MSGPSRNDPQAGASARLRPGPTSRSSAWGDVIVDPAYRANLFVFVIPLLFLLFEIAVSGKKPFFAASVFLIGSFLELLIDGILRLRGLRGRIGARRLVWLQYLNHTVLGLPITVYLASSAMSPAAPLLRLLPVLYLLSRSRVRSQALTHLGLYVAGYLVYAAGLRYAWPGEREFLQAAAGLALGGLVLWREGLAARLSRGAAQTRRSLARIGRRLRATETRETNLLNAILLTPDRVLRYRKHRAVAPVAGDFLCVGVRFPDLHQAVEACVRRAREDRVNVGGVLTEFEHEWNLCVDHYRRGLEAEGCLVLVADEAVYGVRTLSKAGADGRADDDGARLENIEWRVLQLVLNLRSLLDFSSRSRRALEGRGRRGWSARCAIARGPGAFVGRGPANPAIVGRGPVFARLERGLALSGIAGATEPERIWIAEGLAGSVRKAFIGAEAAGPEGRDPGSKAADDAAGRKEAGAATARGAENWFSPTYIRAEYSLKGDGLEPVPDFFERLRYSGGAE